MSRKLRGFSASVLVFLVVFAVLASSILTRPVKGLMDFDQPFYVTMAYDLDRHGVLSNGIFVDIDSTVAEPRPGMFFGPVYPLLVLAAMRVDLRFGEAVRCSVEADRGHRDPESCEPYTRPIRIMHAMLLALGVLAVAITGRRIFASERVFWLTAALATAALAVEAEIFSFVMTEGITFSLYSIFTLALVLAWKTGRPRYFVFSGCLLGALCLTRLSFLAIAPLAVGLTVLYGALVPALRTAMAAGVLIMTVIVATVMGAWTVRNAVSVGKAGLSEEYGSAVLIERFAYNDMSIVEGFKAFPFCTPGLGELTFDTVYGTDSMHRFVYHTPESFFHEGRDQRDRLVRERGRLDPLIGDIVRLEMQKNWWRHLLVSIPLGWCGMWPGWVVSLLLVPLFAYACWRAIRRRCFLFLAYSAPAIAMLGLHAVIANQYTRYNLILIGPYALGAAWILGDAIRRLGSIEKIPTNK